MEQLGLILTAIIVCSLLTALLTQLLGRLRSNRNQRLQTIMVEQKEWRERVSKLVVNSRHAFDQRDLMLFNRIAAELRVRLDPDDKQDKQILALCKSIVEDWDEEKLEEFHDRIAYRLQYDWAQTRREVSSTLFYRYLFILMIVFYATVYAYLEGMFGLKPELIETLGTVQLAMAGSILVVTLWLVLSWLGRLDSRVLSLFLGNPVRRRYRNRRSRSKAEVAQRVRTEPDVSRSMVSKKTAKAVDAAPQPQPKVALKEIRKEA